MLHRENDIVGFRKRNTRNMKFLTQVVMNAEVLKMCIKQIGDMEFILHGYSESEFHFAVTVVKQCFECKVSIKELDCHGSSSERMKIIFEILIDYC